jgi:hypothetical protein
MTLGNMRANGVVARGVVLAVPSWGGAARRSLAGRCAGAGVRTLHGVHRSFNGARPMASEPWNSMRVAAAEAAGAMSGMSVMVPDMTCGVMVAQCVGGGPICRLGTGYARARRTQSGPDAESIQMMPRQNLQQTSERSF